MNALDKIIQRGKDNINNLSYIEITIYAACETHGFEQHPGLIEAAAELAALRARLEAVTRERDEYKRIIDDVRAGNYNNAHDITAARSYIFACLELMKHNATIVKGEA